MWWCSQRGSCSERLQNVKFWNNKPTWLILDFCCYKAQLTLFLSFFVLFCTEKPVSVELSCGAGPSHVVLEPGLPFLLDCNLGASETPVNITWLKDGQLLPPGESNYLHLANGSLLLLPTSSGSDPSQRLEGSYSCVSTSAHGALTSRSVNVQKASRCTFAINKLWPIFVSFQILQ